MGSFTKEKAKMLYRLQYRRVEFISSALKIYFGEQNNPFC